MQEECQVPAEYRANRLWQAAAFAYPHVLLHGVRPPAWPTWCSTPAPSPASSCIRFGQKLLAGPLALPADSALAQPAFTVDAKMFDVAATR